MRVVNDTGGVLGTKLMSDDGAMDFGRHLLFESLNIDFAGVNAVVRATVKLGLVQVDAKAGKTEWMMMNPVTKAIEPVRSIEFMDGTQVSFHDDGEPYVVAYESATESQYVKLCSIGDGNTVKFHRPAGKP